MGNNKQSWVSMSTHIDLSARWAENIGQVVINDDDRIFSAQLSIPAAQRLVADLAIAIKVAEGQS